MLKSSLPSSVMADRIMAEVYNPVNPVKASRAVRRLKPLITVSGKPSLMKGDWRAAIKASSVRDGLFSDPRGKVQADRRLAKKQKQRRR